MCDLYLVLYHQQPRLSPSRLHQFCLQVLDSSIHTHLTQMYNHLDFLLLAEERLNQELRNRIKSNYSLYHLELPRGRPRWPLHILEFIIFLVSKVKNAMIFYLDCLLFFFWNCVMFHIKEYNRIKTTSNSIYHKFYIELF